MKRMTSAYANKLLKQLEEDKNYYLNKEGTSCTYVAAIDEEPVIPEYDFAENAAEIEKIDEKIQAIKHAINQINVMSTIEVLGKEYSVDTVLVRMAQKNRRKAVLEAMRKQLPKERMGGFSNRTNTPEYKYLNYDLKLVQAEYEKVSDEIMAMQIALDKHNQTVEFEVEI